MPMMKDAAPGELMLVQHKIGDDGEVREILYRREPDRPTRYPYTVPTTRLRTMQGHAGAKPRYDSGPVCISDPGESDGRTVYVDPWASLWAEKVVEAVKHAAAAKVAA